MPWLHSFGNEPVQCPFIPGREVEGSVKGTPWYAPFVDQPGSLTDTYRAVKYSRHWRPKRCTRPGFEHIVRSGSSAAWLPGKKVKKGGQSSGGLNCKIQSIRDKWKLNEET